MMEADYIVVGAGSAGCVLANRLSENPDIKVVLLEAGGSDKSWHFHMPLAWHKAVMDTSANWNYMSEPEPHLNNRVLPVPRGKVLGGSSSINGMMYARGHRADYDAWAAMGLEGWSFDDVLPYFRRAENNWRGESEFHGAAGPLTVSRLHDLDKVVSKELLDAAQAQGFERLDDFYAGTDTGFSIPDFTVRNGSRASTSAVYLKPAMTRPNLTVITGALTTRIVIENRRATGVEFVANGHKQRLRCQREVIVSGGAINSPQLLMLSGIGPADELLSLGINPVHDLPGVGQNLIEHTTVICTDEFSQPVSFENELRMDRIAIFGIRWFINKTGPASDMPFGAQGFMPSEQDPNRIGIQLIFSPVSKMANPWFPGLKKGQGHQLTTVGVQMLPKSRGWVKLRSADPAAPPRIQFNMLDHPDDLKAMREIIRRKREITGTPPMAVILKREIEPGSHVQSDEELDGFIRDNVTTSFHPVGTCAMGVDDNAVVDASLRVRGIIGLRVVDASVMPTLISGNTNASVIMIAEKAAAMIRGEI